MRQIRCVILSLTLFYQIYKFITVSKARISKIKLLKTVLTLVPLSPSLLSKHLQTIPNKSKTLLCQGKLTPNEPLASIFDSTAPVAFSKVVSLGKLGGDKRLCKNEPGFLRISDDFSSINLYQSHNSVIIPSAARPVSSQVSFIDGLLQRWFNKKGQVSGKATNYETFGGTNLFEYYIPQGKEYTVLGQFWHKCARGQTLCEFPLMIAPDKETIVNIMTFEVQKATFQRFIYGLLAAILSILLVQQLWKLWSSGRQQNREQPPINPITKIVVSNRTCMVCSKQPSSILSSACQHMSCCPQCWQISGHKCQQCGQVGVQSMQVFIC